MPPSESTVSAPSGVKANVVTAPAGMTTATIIIIIAVIVTLLIGLIYMTMVMKKIIASFEPEKLRTDSQRITADTATDL